MKILETELINLKNSEATRGLLVGGSESLSIHPIVSNICGAPTYSVEVSNDDREGDFKVLDDDLCNVAIDRPIYITYNPFPWKFIRFVTSSVLGDAGNVVFKVGLNGRE